MKRAPITFRIVSLLIAVCILCVTSLPVAAIEVSPDFAPVNTVLYSSVASEAPQSILNLLRTHDVNYIETSMITVESVGTNQNSSIVHVTTKHENIIEDTVLVGYTVTENNEVNQSNFAAEIISSPNVTDYQDTLRANILVRGYTVFTNTSHGSQIYVRPTGQKIACYDYGGTLPSSIRVNTQIQGILADTSFNVVNGDYVYDKTFYKASPAFSTIYTQNGGLSTSRWICPSSDLSYMLRLQVVINGSTYEDNINIFSWLF